MQALVHQIWYGKHWLKWLLWPLSGLFWLISGVRRALFALGIKSVFYAPVPVIVVGNITAGGSGKTPTVLYLIELLRTAGYRPGVISRGYGVHIEAPIRVAPSHTSAQVGDEPAMIFARCSVPMVVGPNRVAAAKTLLACGDVDVIICDDGLQHYALGRNIEIAVIDGERRLGNGLLIPAGPLREGSWRLETVDFRLCNGGQAGIQEIAMSLNPARLLPVQSGNDAVPPKAGETVVAMAGIGNPGRFFATLIEQGFRLAKTKAFDDHQPFTATDIDSLSTFQPLLMTEKDAIKCRGFAKQHWWYLAVDAKLGPDFDTQLLQKVAAAKAGKQGNTHGVR
ncbi:MAG: tetraacyldisaccharide 4'-kinase [Shewanella sp.]|nr:tetraacyldisaccharide 4'-kinase [Shewanella sp.]MCF1437962.1 tetraacyldisaccharide 4'-kinase [Shewanella sp.]MCF1456689.1 tetraacyldisaccharide 4'-kinase [Shewanella sp.]